ncbi:MAG TPA: DNA/RNA nuclease SfsA [Stellaceae bacterium]|nr:DNA/RNA nuclease SfsA [Stellaceae bacterium]
MLYPKPLVRALLLRRYKRFLADIRFEDGSEAVAHCANPGSMLGLAEPGTTVWLLPATGPGRKLAWSWELVDAGTSLVGINTGHANRLAEEAILAGTIPALSGYDTLRREVRYGESSRVDFVLETPGRPICYVEVKSVTLSRQPGLAEFPDTATARGLKHLNELAAMAVAGARAVLLYIIQRGDCTGFAYTADLDPAYMAAARRVHAAGVEVLCHGCRVAPEGIVVSNALPLLI